VQRVAGIAAQVAPLRAGQDQHVQPGRADDRADRVHPGAAVLAHGGEEAEAEPVLVEVPAASRGEVRLLLRELGPGDHVSGRYLGIADIPCQGLSVTVAAVRADRLVSLALLLQARGRVPAHDLAAELEVSVRTVYRDIAALNTAGVPVITEPGPNGGCQLVDGYRFPLRGLSAAEAEALLLLGVPAAVADLGLADATAAARRKVSTSAGAAGRPALVHLDLPRWFHATEPVPHLRTLAEAVRGGRRLLLGYRRDGAGEEKTREVGPLGLVNKAGTWYLVAARTVAPRTRAQETGPPGKAQETEATGNAGAGAGGGPSVYRAGRVTAARLLPAPVNRPDGFNLAAFWEQWTAAFVSSRPQAAVRVRAAPAALAAFPYVFGDAGRHAAEAAGPPGADGWREASLSFEDERAAAHRLAGFGGEVEVLSPAAVRELLVAGARELLERYDRPGW
jgi:predicted DNA-binding transcriptional regulator YafY